MLQVVCAIIQFNNKILIAQRSARMSQPLCWEFPGGKAKEGESRRDALVREIWEELEMDILPQQALSTVTHHYHNISIALHPFICTTANGIFVRKEHAQVLWADLAELNDYNFAPADQPIVKELIELWS